LTSTPFFAGTYTRHRARLAASRWDSADRRLSRDEQAKWEERVQRTAAAEETRREEERKGRARERVVEGRGTMGDAFQGGIY
ncbi:hypothetical protein LTS18_001939, partial [Coniosporium uncinatum]